MLIIDGKSIAQKILGDLKQKIQTSGKKPGLSVILIGDDAASRLYVSIKEKACAEVGIYFEKHLFKGDEPEEKILSKIEALNQRPNIHGIIVQLPLPSQYNPDKIVAAIDPKKDADGFHPENIRLLNEKKSRIEPALIKAIWRLLEEALQQGNIKTLEHLKALIIGKSDIFIAPLENFLKQKGLFVNHAYPDKLQTIIKISQSETNYHKDLAKRDKLQNYDIVISAVGKPNLINASLIKDGAAVIDVGTSFINGKTVGDVDAESLKQKTGFLTPVPGGVGPVTVAMLLKNVFELSVSK